MVETTSPINDTPMTFLITDLSINVKNKLQSESSSRLFFLPRSPKTQRYWAQMNHSRAVWDCATAVNI